MSNTITIFGINYPETEGFKVKDNNGITHAFTEGGNGDISVLPSGYTQLEYIRFSGSQYINTNITPVEGDAIKMIVLPQTDTGAIFSCGADTYQLILLNLKYYKYFATGSAAELSPTLSANKVYEIIASSTFTAKTAGSSDLTVTSAYASSIDGTSNKLWIGARVNNTSYFTGCIYSFSLTNEGTVKANFVPCVRKADGKAGMYDLVSETFFPSATNTDIEAGAPAVNVPVDADLGTKSITSNGTYNASSDSLDGYSSVTVNVSGGGGGTMQSKSVSYTPTTSTQSGTVTPDSGYDGLSSVAISVAAMPTGTAGTPSASKGTVSNHAVSITPSVTNTTGYITGGTETGTAVTVSASELVSGTKSISANGTGIDVTNYASVDVAVPATIPNLQSKTATPTESVQTITADTGYDGLDEVEVGAISSTYVGSGITRRSSTDLSASGATVTVPSGYYSSQASKAVASGSATPASSISATGATVTTGTNTLTLSKSVSNTPQVSAGYISSGTAGNSSVSLTATINTRSSSDLTVSGATVTAPAGYYANQATKSVSSMTLPTSTSSSATSGYTSKATIGRSTSNQYINIPPGYNSAGAYYTISAVTDGTEGTPTATKGSVSNHSISVTPSVTNSAGYISGGTKTGTAVTVSASELVSGTLSITSTGTKDVTNYASANVSIPFVTYYVGYTTPDSSLGNNNDIYLKLESNAV